MGRKRRRPRADPEALFVRVVSEVPFFPFEFIPLNWLTSFRISHPPEVSAMTLLRAAFALCLVFFPLSVASAAPVVIEAGQTFTLAEDLVLAGADTLEVRGSA